MVYNLCRCSELAESEEHLLFRHHYWPLSDSSHAAKGAAASVANTSAITRAPEKVVQEDHPSMSPEDLVLTHVLVDNDLSVSDKGGNFVHEKVQEKDPYKHYKHVSIAMFAVLQFL